MESTRGFNVCTPKPLPSQNWSDRLKNVHVFAVDTTSFPGSFLSPKKDPGSGWSRASLTKIIRWEESPCQRNLSRCAFVKIKTRLAQTAMFFRSLQFAVVNSSYWNINLKPKQVKCLEAVYSGRDIIAVLPTGYGKSIIFHLLPALFFDKINCGRTPASLPIHPVVVVVSPLNSLISDQIRRSTQGKVKATILNVKKKANSDDLLPNRSLENFEVI